MTVVSGKEFTNHQDKYFELAIKERVYIKKNNYTFFVTNADEELDEIIEYQKAKSHKSDAIPFDVAFAEIEAFVNQ